MLVDSQCLTSSVTGYQLKLGIRQTTVPGQPGDRLVPKRVRGRLHASLFGVHGDNLLDTTCRELAVSLSLEDPTVMRVSCDVRSQRRGEAFAEQDVAILRAFSQIDPDLAGFKINIGDSEVAEFRDSDSRVEQEP